MAHLKHLTKISLCLLVQYEFHLWSLKLSFRSWPDKPYLILVSVLYHGCSNSCTLAGWLPDVQLLAMVRLRNFNAPATCMSEDLLTAAELIFICLFEGLHCALLAGMFQL